MKPKETRIYLNGIIAPAEFTDYAAKVLELSNMDVDPEFLERFKRYHRVAGKPERPAFDRVVHSALDGMFKVTDTYVIDCWSEGHYPQNVREYELQQGKLNPVSNKNRFMPPGH